MIMEMGRQVLGWVVLCPQVLIQTEVTVFSSAPLHIRFFHIFIMNVVTDLKGVPGRIISGDYKEIGCESTFFCS